MMNPVSAAAAAAHAHYAEQTASKPPQPPQHSASWPHDKVTIKGHGDDADHDGDKK